MADTNGYIPNQYLDLNQIQEDAQHRWLRPAEICKLLCNHQKFQLSSSPPVRPPAGSLFLFNRKVLRYFRKDGHRWRKKKDGKTVKEAHEKLKAGSVDVLHCYYAHGEDNEAFQRRSYWMLDERFENIVLVHYREVKEGYKSGAPHLLNADSGSLLISSHMLSPSFEQTTSTDQTLQTSYASNQKSVDWNEQTVSSRLETSSLVHLMSGCLPHENSFHAVETAGCLKADPFGSGFSGAGFDPNSSLSAWVDFHGSVGNTLSVGEPKFYVDPKRTADFLSYKLTDARLDDSISQVVLSCGKGPFPDSHVVQVHSDSRAIDSHAAKSGNCTEVGILSNQETGGLKKLDSFGRWMDKEIGGDCDASLMASDSGNYWNPLDSGNAGNEVSSLSHHMQLNTDSVGPSLSQEQLFSICDYAPDWAYSGVETKVLITGTFLGDKKHSSGNKWCCMFGETEVSAEAVMDNAIRCQVPFHAPGRVPFYITCSNRLACSEVREFEYLENPSKAATRSADQIALEDEFSFLIRLAKLLTSRLQRKWLGCSAVNCEKCKLKDLICSLEDDKERSWKRITEVFEGSFKDLLIQNLLKDKLYDWLLCEIHDTGEGLRTLDEKGQGVIHLAAALGYEWAVGPIAAAGVSLNFRDLRGKTALHWASLYGREETVVVLIKLGAFAGAVDDPTPSNPGGQKAADLASSRGHKGIAGYLAEADLTSHLSALSVKEDVTDNAAATVAAKNAMEIADQSVHATDEEHSLRGSLAAIRNSAHAAALIQDAFRVRSFRHRQLSTSINDSPEVQDLVALGSLHKAQKVCHFEDYLHSAALRIQQKYRGWKQRNDFLKIRDNVVKIQAHFRGHQVRKHYKKVVRAVGIVEKAILRWRRKRPGLRGFRIELSSPEAGKNDEYDFLQIGRRQKSAGVDKALARVRSMARCPEARNQYMRLVSKFEKLSHEESSRLQQDGNPGREQEQGFVGS